MKFMTIVLKAVVVALAAAQPVAAVPANDAQGARYYAQAQGPRSDSMRQPQRDFRRAERPPEGDSRRDGRLTDEERRELRRDIDRANREIYKARQ